MLLAAAQRSLMQCASICIAAVLPAALLPRTCARARHPGSGLASATPSLTHLADLLLGRTLRGTDGTSVHDSVEDASAAMALVVRELQQEAPTPPLAPPAIKVRAAIRKKTRPTGSGPLLSRCSVGCCIASRRVSAGSRPSCM